MIRTLSHRDVHVDELRALEAEAVHIIREVAAELERPVLLFSAGKDSIVLLRLAEKAFRPARLPFPVLHVDTGHNFPEVIDFRDRRVTQPGHRLIVASVQESIDSGRVKETGLSRNRLQTRTLLDALAYSGFDAAFGGARRDEERSRAKERVLSFRDEFGQWDPRAQRPEPWSLYNGKMVCWFAAKSLVAGDRLVLKHTTTTSRATVQSLHTRLDPETLAEQDHPVGLTLNDIGTVTIRTASVLIADRYADNRDSGSFILIDESTNDTVGAGTILDARAVSPGTEPRRDIRWHPSSLDRTYRWSSLGHRGATIWFTGLPASGKSTIAVALERALVEAGRPAYLLDGDNVRHGLSDDLGFSPGDRAENIRRVGHLTRLFADAGFIALASLVSPLESDRAIARALNQAAKLPFIEVHVATPVEECERRDPKGLYARARRGELKGLTGVDAPYERPQKPDLVIDTTDADIDELVEQVLDILANHTAKADVTG